MGTARLQGALWGARAQDWATYAEQVSLPLFGAALDAARVTAGTRLLDAGCGAGLLSLLASLRGAVVAAVDAAPALISIARQRMPQTDVCEADLEALPFRDDTFDAVVVVNSIFYVANIRVAARELVRVTRQGGRVLVTAWGPPHRCEFLAAVMPELAALLPPTWPGAIPPRPGALSAPGALEAILDRAGLNVVEEGEVACPFLFESPEMSWRANSSCGFNRAAIEHSGEAAVRAVYAEADRQHQRPDGSVRYDNVFLWCVGEKP